MACLAALDGVPGGSHTQVELTDPVVDGRRAGREDGDQPSRYRGESERRDVSSFVLQPLLNINLDQGWFITSKPIITANWKASSSERWLVPVGGGIGKVFRIGRFGLSLEAEAFGYPERPAGGPTWSVGLGVKVLFKRGQILERIRELGSQTPSS